MQENVSGLANRGYAGDLLKGIFFLLGLTFLILVIIYLKVVAIPSEAWGKFFTGDAYIIFARSTFSKSPFSPSP